jgi:hypothetical protein
VDQIAALPLGGRIKVDAWTGRITLSHSKPVALLSAREKLPFEITPFMPYLTHQSSTDLAAAGIKTAEAPAQTQPSTVVAQAPADSSGQKNGVAQTQPTATQPPAGDIQPSQPTIPPSQDPPQKN